jgi:hypothetical protein
MLAHLWLLSCLSCRADHLMSVFLSTQVLRCRVCVAAIEHYAAKRKVMWQEDIRVILKVTLCFTPYLLCSRPYPVFQWYPQSNENLLHLGMKCI